MKSVFQTDKHGCKTCHCRPNVCPARFPRLEIYNPATSQHGNVCRHEGQLTDGYHIGWVCPLGCERADASFKRGETGAALYCRMTGTRNPCSVGAIGNQAVPVETGYELVATGTECGDRNIILLSEATSNPAACAILARGNKKCGDFFEVRKERLNCRCNPADTPCMFKSDSDTILYDLNPIVPGGPQAVDGRGYWTEQSDTNLLPEVKNQCVPQTDVSSLGADYWLNTAQMEQASVASFAKVTISLMTFGAPLKLVELSQFFSMDEVVHAQRALELAGVYELDKLPQHSLKFDQNVEAFAIDNFQNGCIGETFAVVRSATRLQEDLTEQEHAFFEMVVRDESTHAVFAWSVMKWLVKNYKLDWKKILDISNLCENEGRVAGGLDECQNAEVKIIKPWMKFVLQQEPLIANDNKIANLFQQEWNSRDYSLV